MRRCLATLAAAFIGSVFGLAPSSPVHADTGCTQVVADNSRSELPLGEAPELAYEIARLHELNAVVRIRIENTVSDPAAYIQQQVASCASWREDDHLNPYAVVLVLSLASNGGHSKPYAFLQVGSMVTDFGMEKAEVSQAGQAMNAVLSAYHPDADMRPLLDLSLTVGAQYVADIVRENVDDLSWLILWISIVFTAALTSSAMVGVSYSSRRRRI